MCTPILHINLFLAQLSVVHIPLMLLSGSVVQRNSNEMLAEWTEYDVMIQTTDAQ